MSLSFWFIGLKCQWWKSFSKKKSEITSFKGVAEKVNDYWPIQVWKRWFLCHSSVFHIWPFWRSTLSFSMGCHIIKSCDEILLIVAQRLVHSLLVLYWSALLHVYFGLLLWCMLRMHMHVLIVGIHLDLWT